MFIRFNLFVLLVYNFILNEQKVIISVQKQRKRVSIDVPDVGGSKPVTTESDAMKPNISIIPVTRL